MTRPACLELRTQLQEIKELKAQFDPELPKIKDTRNTAPALKLEEEIREKIKFIREALFLDYELVEVTIGTKSKEELIRELEEREKSNNPEDKIYITDNARVMLYNPDFVVVNKAEKITLIRLKVKDLGFEQESTTDQIYKRAKELGLALCPPEIGPYLRLNYQEVFKRKQPKEEYLHIGMQPIASPYVFNVVRDDDGYRSLSYWGKPKWNLENEFVFIRK